MRYANHCNAKFIPPSYRIAQSVRPDILNLANIEIDIPPHAAVINSIIHSLTYRTVALHKYPNQEDDQTKALKADILSFLGIRENAVKKDVLLTHGSDTALRNIIDSYMNAASLTSNAAPKSVEFIIPYNSYPHFEAFIKLHFGDRDTLLHRYSDDNLGEKSEHSKLENVLADYPHKDNVNVVAYIPNPTMAGSSYDPELIAALTKKYPSVLFVIDEAYHKFSAKEASTFPSAATLLNEPNVYVVGSFSKTFALADIRLGYVVGHPHMIDVIARLNNSKDVTTYAKRAARAAIDNWHYYKTCIEQIMLTNVPYILQRLPLIASHQGYGPFLFLKFEDEKQLRTVCDRLETEYAILIRNKHPQLQFTARVTVPYKKSSCKAFCDAIETLVETPYDIVLWDLDGTLRKSCQDKELTLPCGLTPAIGKHHLIVTNNMVDYDVRLPDYIKDIWRPPRSNDFVIGGPPLTLEDFHMLCVLYQCSAKTSCIPPVIHIADDHRECVPRLMSQFRSSPFQPSNDFVLPDTRFYAEWLRDHCALPSWNGKSEIVYIGKDSATSVESITSWMKTWKARWNLSDACKVLVVGDSDTDERLSQKLGAVFKRVEKV